VTDGCCAKIMTGSPVPEGADCVVPVEDTRLDAAGAMLCERVPGRDNISRCGEDCLKGATLLSAGTIICPQDIAVLASVGCSMPLVSRKVRVAIIATGDELIEPDAATPESDSAKIRNSNAYQLIAQVERAGATARYFGIVKDDEDSLTETFCAAKNDSDILLVSGGVSMGDFDYVPAALTRAGFRFLFEKIKIKPGKPTVFGTDGERYCFGLPGNPVSTFVVFEILVRDFIAALQGAAPSCATVPLKLAETISRKNIERHDMIPVRYGADGLVHPVLCHGSGHFHALHGANGLIGFPVGVARLQEGALVDVRPI
jgi:molybdopterin molybdotransferase